jgi:methionine synthase II (cobalamin-independent)
VKIADMVTSRNRILTTHVGRLPRTKEVVGFLFAQDRGEPFDAAAFDAALQHAVEDAVGRQAGAGIDIVSDGEMSKTHHRDIPLARVLLKAKPMALVIEGANPRHEHEWDVWKTNPWPPGKILVPGVIDSSCNFVEHPELVSQRIVRYAELVGRDRVIAGTDCGFGTFAGFAAV